MAFWRYKNFCALNTLNTLGGQYNTDYRHKVGGTFFVNRSRALAPLPNALGRGWGWGWKTVVFGAGD